MKQINDFLSSLPMTILAGIFLVISLALNLAGIPCTADPAWLAVVISGIPMLYLALSRLIRDHWVSSALLISIAMLASLAIGEIFAAGEVAFIMAIGAILEDLTVARAKRGLSKLIALAPSEGRRITKEGGSWIEEMIPAQQIRPGDLLRILPGEKIPADGMIRTGSTSVDQSILTGESLPADKTAGDSVFCGTLNCYGSIDIEAVSVGEDSSLQKLIALVKEAETKKAPMQRIADKWAVWLVPIALLIAVLGFLINWALGAGLMNALNRCVTVLVVFCPCALALATPVSVMAAIGQATKHGIIIKSGEALEKMGKVTAIAFDKTGTLTYGKLTVSDIRPFTEEIDACTLLFFTASAEAKSEHPLAKAITACAKEKGILLKQSSRFQMDAGKGIRAVIGANRVLCGSENYLSDHGVLLPDAAADVLGELRKQGKATILTALDGRCIGVLALSDVLKETAKDMIVQLAALDTKTVLLTGDNEMAADYFAGQLNITQVCAGLLPEQKVEKIAQLQQRYGSVCMIGDGVNDAPALKTADVGIAMGSMGSDIAVEAADIALMGDDISKIPYLKRLSRSAIRTIKGNITVSMCINFVAVTLSVLGVLNPVTGALVHNAGSVLVVLNAALLYDRNFEDT